MNFKYVIGIVVVILLIVNIFFMYNAQFSSNSLDNDVGMIGDTLIKLPKGYSVINAPDLLEFSDGVNKIKLFKINETDVDSAVNNYRNSFSENFTISLEDLSSEVPIKKTVATDNNTTVCKYWFKSKNNCYQMQVYKNDPKFDDIAKEISKSMN